MTRFFLLSCIALLFYSCDKAVPEPVLTTVGHSGELKKVIHSIGDSIKKTTDFTYYPDGKLMSVHKVISWKGEGDTIIVMEYAYEDSKLSSLITTITAPSGINAFVETFSYENGNVTTYFDGEAQIIYQFYQNTNGEHDYILTSTGDSIDVSYPDASTIRLKNETCVACMYTYVEFNKIPNELVFDSVPQGLPDDRLVFARYKNYINPFEKEVWNAFGPSPEIGKIFQLLLDGADSHKLLVMKSDRRSASYSGNNLFYNYTMDEFSRIRTIDVDKSHIFVDPKPGGTATLTYTPKSPHNYTLYY